MKRSVLLLNIVLLLILSFVVGCGNPPELSVHPSSDDLEDDQREYEGVVELMDKTVKVENTGGETLNWSASAKHKWIILDPKNGSLGSGDAASIKIYADLTGLAAGDHTGTITISGSGATGSSKEVKVVLHVYAHRPQTYAIIIVGGHEEIFDNSGEAFRNWLIDNRRVDPNRIEKRKPKGLIDAKNKNADAEIKKIFQGFLKKHKATLGSEDTIYLYLVGHATGPGFALDIESESEGANPPKHKKVHYSEIFNQLDRLPPANVNIIVDGCESGNAITLLKRFRKENSSPKRHTIVTSADGKTKPLYYKWDDTTWFISELIRLLKVEPVRGAPLWNAGNKLRKALEEAPINPRRYKPQVERLNPRAKVEEVKVTRDDRNRTVTVKGKVSYADGTPPATFDLGLILAGYVPVRKDGKIEKYKPAYLGSGGLFYQKFKPSADGSFSHTFKGSNPSLLYEVHLGQPQLEYNESRNTKNTIFTELLSDIPIKPTAAPPLEEEMVIAETPVPEGIGERISDITPTPTPTLPPTHTPTPTQEDIVEQINRAIAAKGYDWEAGMTAIAGLNPEEIQMLHLIPQEIGALCTEITGSACKFVAHRVISPEEIKQSLDAEGLLVGEMIVYEDFLYYEGGVYRHTWGDQIGSHAVEIEGYDDTEGYWRVRNSWGTGWGESGYFRMAYGEAGVEDNVYEIAYVTTPTPAPPPTATPTPAPTGIEYVDECIAYLEQGRALLAEHETGGCTEGLRLLRLAIDRSNAALELDPNNALAYFCRGMSRSCLEEGQNEAIEDLQSALDLGLAGDRTAEAEQELAKLIEKAAAPICVSMGTPIFAEGWRWDEGEPINANTTFPVNSTREVWARWTLSNPCNEVAVVKWYHNGVHTCQHDTDELTGEYDGSGWIADEEWIETGEWCVAVYINDVEKTRGCFTVTEQPTPPPSSGAPDAPEILSIEFPSTIPADGTPVDGRLHFKDNEGDINWVSFDVISGDFSGFGFNLMDYIVEGGVEQGVSLFNMHCNVVQDVTMRVTLTDTADNKSSPVDFSFSCR